MAPTASLSWRRLPIGRLQVDPSPTGWKPALRTAVHGISMGHASTTDAHVSRVTKR